MPAGGIPVAGSWQTVGPVWEVPTNQEGHFSCFAWGKGERLLHTNFVALDNGFCTVENFNGERAKILQPFQRSTAPNGVGLIDFSNPDLAPTTPYGVLNYKLDALSTQFRDRNCFPNHSVRVIA